MENLIKNAKIKDYSNHEIVRSLERQNEDLKKQADHYVKKN